MGLFDRFKKSNKAATTMAAPTAAKAVAVTTAKPAARAAVANAKSQVKASTVAAANTAAVVENVANVLVNPVVTEKSTKMGAYFFQVTKSASKNEIAKAFKARFGKTPRKVNIVNVLGKTKFRGRTAGKRADWKKAIVYLNKGETVDTSK